MISCFERNIDDALHNVDSPITEVELVMQILRQLSAPYHIIVDVITNTKAFPSFLQANNIFLLHEPCAESPEIALDFFFANHYCSLL